MNAQANAQLCSELCSKLHTFQSGFTAKDDNLFKKGKNLGFCLDFRFKMNLFAPYNVAINNRTSKTGKMILN